MKTIFNQLTLKTKLISLICAAFIFSVVVEYVYTIHMIKKEFYHLSSQRFKDIAELVSTNHNLINQVSNPTSDNLKAIQYYTEQVRQLALVDFVVIFNMQGVQYSHLDKSKTGQQFVGGNEQKALQATSYLSTARGALSDSITASSPIYNDNKQQIGIVLVGQTRHKMNYLALKSSQPVWSLLVSFTLAVIFVCLLSRHIKMLLCGLKPNQIDQLFEEHNAIIRAVKEGIVVINRNGLISQINDEAIRILHMDKSKENIIGKPISTLIPNARLNEVMNKGIAEYNCEQNINGMVILTNRIPLFVKNKLVGAIASFRDITEIRQLSNKLTSINRDADALRSQSHEFNNKLHVIYGLAYQDNKQELVNYLEEIIGNKQPELDEISQYIKDPIITGFLNSKLSQIKELGVSLTFNINGMLAPISNHLVIHHLITILGNLIDNSLDAVHSLADKKIELNFTVQNGYFYIEIIDNGIGISEKDVQHIFQKGYSTKGDNRGMGLYLVLSCVDELGGNIQLFNLSKKKGTCFKISLPLAVLYREAS
ncbi:ATP-binding protein [Gilliamella sp. wkB308]|uniref:ATP-binding protein n=1 Tax=Gilliamella sp. wkB308 TaxID=3120263 RepID=UPI00080E04C0|nr:ATP-binding protein [Gilliamella apicola]OCF96513.1 hypothetical protein A9G10_08635 [Gilliamella apicola]